MIETRILTHDTVENHYIAMLCRTEHNNVLKVCGLVEQNGVRRKSLLNVISNNKKKDLSEINEEEVSIPFLFWQMIQLASMKLQICLCIDDTR